MSIAIEPAKVDSRRVYAIAREVVGKVARNLGFKRGNSMLSWMRPQGSQHLTFWFQVSQFGWARYTGSQFTVEFQLWKRPEVGASLQRARLPELLNDADWDELRQRQNLVISRLVRPPRSYIESMRSASADIEAMLSRQFEQIEQIDKPYEKETDIWFRYASENDVREWCTFIKARLPSAIEKFLKAFARD